MTCAANDLTLSRVPGLRLLPARKLSFAHTVLFAVLGTLPFAFGGIRPVAFYGASAVLLLVASSLTVQQPGKSYIRTLGALLLLAVYAISRSGALTEPVVTFAVSVASCAALMHCVTSLGLRVDSRFPLVIGALVACTSLAHWLVDNGKFLWIFSPEILERNPRARFPFVNPNHLGAFLLGPCLFALANLESALQSIRIAGRRRRRRELELGLRTLTTAGALACLFLITLVLTTSKGALLGLTAGSITYFILSPGSIGRRLAVLPTLLVAIIALQPGTQTSLGSRFSGETFESRKVLYSSGLAMIRETPWFGVGVGKWRETFLRQTAVADLDPVYLHSDPLQIVVELGVIGVLPLAMLSGLLILKSWRGRKNPHVALLAATVTAMAAAGCVDFSFRIPAVLYWFALYAAWLVAATEETSNRIPSATVISGS